MSPGKSNGWILADLGTGFVAILAVVGVSVRASFVGSDLRALFAVTGLAFYLAGLVRGGERRLPLAVRGLLVSCPGLLGTAALVVNDGLHRWPIPAAVSLSAIAFTTLGLFTRRIGRERGGTAAAFGGLCALALVLEVASVRSLVVSASLHRLDRPAPEFTLAGFGGEPVRSADLRGKVVVLAFWASWCLPCRWEMPELQSAARRLGGDSGVVVLAVDAGWGGETIERSRRLMARKGWTLPAAYDSAGAAAAALHVHALPTMLFLDREGRVRFEHYGFDRSERLEDLVLRCVEALRSR